MGQRHHGQGSRAAENDSGTDQTRVQLDVLANPRPQQPPRGQEGVCGGQELHVKGAWEGKEERQEDETK